MVRWGRTRRESRLTPDPSLSKRGEGREETVTFANSEPEVIKRMITTMYQLKAKYFFKALIFCSCQVTIYLSLVSPSLKERGLGVSL
jgi:hypothetical protein